MRRSTFLDKQARSNGFCKQKAFFGSFSIYQDCDVQDVNLWRMLPGSNCVFEFVEKPELYDRNCLLTFVLVSCVFCEECQVYVLYRISNLPLTMPYWSMQSPCCKSSLNLLWIHRQPFVSPVKGLRANYVSSLGNLCKFIVSLPICYRNTLQVLSDLFPVNPLVLPEPTKTTVKTLHRLTVSRDEMW